MLKQIQTTADENIRKQLDLALETINQLNEEIRLRNGAFIEMLNEYAALANAAQGYLADPSGLTRPHLEFLLAKAPK